MINDDQQLGGPQALYTGTAAQIEALASPVTGAMAFATDTMKIGVYNGSAWTWGAGGGVPDVHKTSHQDGGSDEINVDDLSGRLQDPQNADAFDGMNLIGDFMDYLDMGPIVWANEPPGGTFQPWVLYDPSQFENGGAHEINVDGLSGVLALPQDAGWLQGRIVYIVNIDDGQVLAWSDANNRFQPTTISGSGGDADTVDGYHAAAFSLLASGVTLYVNGSTGSDSNTGLSAGQALATIQAAINKFKGRVLSGCAISVAAGTYNESLDLSGLKCDTSNLTIAHDTPSIHHGMTYMHGGSPTYVDVGTGSGAVTLATSNAGGKCRVTVTRAGGNPDFANYGVTTSHSVQIWDGTNFVTVAIYAVGTNYIDLNTATIYSLASAGRFMTILPRVKVVSAAGIGLRVDGCGARAQGLWLVGATHGVKVMNLAALDAPYCVIQQTATNAWRAAAQVQQNSFLGNNVGDNPWKPIAFFGKWGGAFMANACSAALGSAFLFADSYGLVCSGNSAADAGSSQVGVRTGATGYYALNAGYVAAGSTNASNNASTKYSPATSDALGNSNGSITWS